MTKIDVCKYENFEWRNGELFVIPDTVGETTAWVNSDTAEAIRNDCPPELEGSEDFPFFLIERTPTDDKIYEVTDMVTFAGGAVLCSIKPMIPAGATKH